MKQKTDEDIGSWSRSSFFWTEAQMDFKIQNQNETLNKKKKGVAKGLTFIEITPGFLKTF